MGGCGGFAFAGSWQEYTTLGSESSPLGRGTVGTPCAGVVDGACSCHLACSDGYAVGEQYHAVHAAADISSDGGVSVAGLRSAEYCAASGAFGEDVAPLGAGQRTPA